MYGWNDHLSRLIEYCLVQKGSAQESVHGSPDDMISVRYTIMGWKSTPNRISVIKNVFDLHLICSENTTEE